VMSSIAKIPVESVVKGVLPFFVTRIVALGILTYVPWLSLVLL
jgi:C4-dicarboxylate transporter DctM subunit